MNLRLEIKRKVFHNLSLIYMIIYWITPHWFSFWFFGVLTVSVWAIDHVRIVRPELNAWFLGKFEGMYRPAEVMAYSGILWTLFGCWAVMGIFPDKPIVLSVLGFLIFGDAVAAIAGKRWGKRPWPHNPQKTMEGSAAFALVSTIWASLFLPFPVALISACIVAWIETKPWLWNDNFRRFYRELYALGFWNRAYWRKGAADQTVCRRRFSLRITQSPGVGGTPISAANLDPTLSCISQRKLLRLHCGAFLLPR